MNNLRPGAASGECVKSACFCSRWSGRLYTNGNFTACSQEEHLYYIKKRCIIYMVKARVRSFANLSSKVLGDVV